MNKKIIAVALAMVLLASLFVGCGRNYKKAEIDGKEYYVITNKNGEYVMGEDGVAVAVTDEKGKVIKNEDGEPQTRYIIQKHDIEAGEKVLGSNYDLLVLDGWTGDSGAIYKDDTDEQCYITCSKVIELENKQTIKDILAELDENNQTLVNTISDKSTMEQLAQANPELEQYKDLKVTFDKSEKTIGIHKFQIRVFKIIDKDGKVIHYAENYYFVSDETVYSVNYACVNGIGYDSTFDFAGYITNGFTFYPEKSK